MQLLLIQQVMFLSLALLMGVEHYSNVGLRAPIVKYDSSGTKLLTKTFATSQSDIASGIKIYSEELFGF